MTTPHIILGTAHFYTTPGKRSPGDLLRESSYSREMVKRIGRTLSVGGLPVHYDYLPAMPPDFIKKAPLSKQQSLELQMRVKIVNDLCDKYGADNCIYVSVHVNAAGSGNKWMNARGWSAYTSPGHTKADDLADQLYIAARSVLKGHRIREDRTDGDADWEANFYVLSHTKCPAVLTENLFQDNQEDVLFLLSEEGRAAIERLHVDGIRAYLTAR